MRILRSTCCALALLVPATLASGADAEPAGPGALVNTNIGSCTENFLFDGSDGARYVATAGHCVLAGPDVGAANLGEHSWAPGAGPVASDIDGRRIGTFVYAIEQDPKDFALIRLDPAVLATPQMPVFGGPVGIFTDTSAANRALQYYGRGAGVGDLAPSRYAVAFGAPDPDHIYAWGLAAPGDSGSAIETSDGLAAGVIVTTGLHTGSVGGSGIDAGLIGITRLPPQVGQAGSVLGIALSLRTAPLLDGSSQPVAPSTSHGPTTAPVSSGGGQSAGAPSSSPATKPIPPGPRQRTRSHHRRHAGSRQARGRHSHRHAAKRRRHGHRSSPHRAKHHK